MQPEVDNFIEIYKQAHKINTVNVNDEMQLMFHCKFQNVDIVILFASPSVEDEHRKFPLFLMFFMRYCFRIYVHH